MPLVLSLIKELAESEQIMADQVVATEADVHRALFGTPPYAEAVISPPKSSGAHNPYALSAIWTCR